MWKRTIGGALLGLALAVTPAAVLTAQDNDAAGRVTMDRADTRRDADDRGFDLGWLGLLGLAGLVGLKRRDRDDHRHGSTTVNR